MQHFEECVAFCCSGIYLIFYSDIGNNAVTNNVTENVTDSYNIAINKA